MKRILLFATALTLGANTMAQTADFETQLPGLDTAWFGQPTDGDTVFTSGLFTFENNYNSSWNSWSGWAYSNDSDNITSGYTNQFGNITGTGEASNQFGMSYVSDFSNNRLFTSNGNAVSLSQMSVTNSTYAYLSMLNGDAFAKQFGSPNDASGNPDGTNGEDWFLLTIYGLGSDSLHTGDSVTFYLADYRFADNTLDYIVDSWTVIDLSSLGAVYGLDFNLTSSDNGQYGMNTPAYFAMDNLSVDFTEVEENIASHFSVYPNPTTGLLNINIEANSKVDLYTINGQLIKTITSNSNQLQWDLTDLSNGIYFIQVEKEGIISTQKIIKQ